LARAPIPDKAHALFGWPSLFPFLVALLHIAHVNDKTCIVGHFFAGFAGNPVTVLREFEKFANDAGAGDALCEVCEGIEVWIQFAEFRLLRTFYW
jgi:hypothetical protein